jgi:solute carrier family 50 (sugar transporter)
MNVALYGVMVAFLQFYVQGRRRVSVAGGIGAAFAFAVFVAPLAIIVSTTISGSSVDYLPTIVSRTY